MKAYSIIVLIVITGFFTSCIKEHCDDKPDTPVLRKVRYELWAADNFAGQKNNITFRILMRNDRTRKVYIDSSLATMKLDEMPDFDHRIIIEKFVPNNDTATLSVGIVNFLEGPPTASSAWRFEDFEKGDNFIAMKWAFR